MGKVHDEILTKLTAEYKIRKAVKAEEMLFKAISIKSFNDSTDIHGVNKSGALVGYRNLLTKVESSDMESKDELVALINKGITNSKRRKK